MKHIQKIDILGSDNVGLYIAASDTYTIIGMSVRETDIEDIKVVLQTPILQTTICGTSLVGIFIYMTDEYIFVPDIAFDFEVTSLQKTGLKVVSVPTKLTALGNNMIYNNKTLFVSKEFEDSAIEAIKNSVDVQAVHRVEIADTDVVGSCIAFNKKGGIVHPQASDSTLDLFEEVLQIPLTKGTVNMQSPYIKSGLVPNSNGFIIGKATSGSELVHIDEALGFLDEEDE